MTVRKGYTLIEILIVIALFSILVSMIIPKLSFFNILSERQEIAELKKDLLYAREMAIIENKSYMVYFFHDKNSYSIKTSEAGPVIKSKTFDSGLKLNIDNGSFIFNPSGAAGKSNTIYINTNRNKRYAISLSPATSRIEIKLE